MRKPAWTAIAVCALGMCALQAAGIVVQSSVSGVSANVKVIGAPDARAAKDKAAQPFSSSVVDEAGKPIAGAKVHIYSSAKAPVVLVTGKDGKFTYRPPVGTRKGGYRVLAVASGYAYCLASGDPQGLAKPMVLRKEQLLKGMVVDESGKPLDGVAVSVDYAWGYSRTGGSSYDLYNMPLAPKATTDAKGAFVLRHLPETSGFDQYSVTLRLNKPGRADITRNLDKRVLSEPARVVLPVGGVLQGKLLLPDRTDAPAGEWLISLRVSGKWGSNHKSAGVEKDGSFRLKDMPPGNVDLSVQQMQARNRNRERTSELQPYALAAQQFEIMPAETKNIELVLQNAACARGTVVDAKTGKPIAGAELRVRHAGHIEDSYGESQSTGEQGAFSVVAPAGDLNISLSHIRDPQGSYYYFDSENGPGATLTLAEGEKKTDVVIKIDLSEAQSGGAAGRLATPKDFELVPGTYALTWDPELDTGRIHDRNKPKPSAEVKALVKKLPAGLSGKAVFSANRIDGKDNSGLLCTILDGGKLYVDSNRNWDLSDDTPIEFTLPTQQHSVKRLSWVEVPSHQGPPQGRHTTHPIKLRPSIYASPSGPVVWLDRKGAWKGVLETNKGKAEFALVDFDLNGVYGDRRAVDAEFMPTGGGDMIAVDTAARGKVSAQYSGGGGAFWFEPASKVAGKFYAFKASHVGDSLTVEPYTGPLGQIDIRFGLVQGLKGKPVGGAYLLTPNGFYELMDDEPPFTVPAGPCRVYYAMGDLDSQTGPDLNIRYSSAKPVTVEPNKAAFLEIAGDLSMRVGPKSGVLTWESGKTTDLHWNIKIGDSITVDGIGQQNDSDAPTIKLFDAKGKMAAKIKAGFT